MTRITLSIIAPLFAMLSMAANFENTSTIVLSATKCDGDTTLVADNIRGRDVKELILPISLTAIGSIGLLNDSPLKKWSSYTHKEIIKHSYHTNIDNWGQYLPAAIHLGLGVTGIKSKHKFVDRIIVASTAYSCMTILTNGLKYALKEKRPDSNAHNSFPSGHTATAFTGAELVRIEYGNGIGVIAYTMASAIGIMRVYNDRHWIHDVISGAGIGIFSAKMGSWMLPVWKKIFNCKKDSTISVVPYANPNGKTYSLTACMII